MNLCAAGYPNHLLDVGDVGNVLQQHRLPGQESCAKNREHRVLVCRGADNPAKRHPTVNQQIRHDNTFPFDNLVQAGKPELDGHRQRQSTCNAAASSRGFMPAGVCCRSYPLKRRFQKGFVGL